MPTTGALSDRVIAFVATRTRIYELAAPFSRAARLVAPDSPGVTARLDGAAAAARQETASVFAPELAARPAADGAELLAALAAVSSWQMWDSLRVDRGLSPVRARAVVSQLVTALVEEQG